jgi:NitT/TauT family transport system substrate-binding protein
MMRVRGLLTLMVCLILVALAAAACSGTGSSGSGASGEEPLTIGLPAPNANMWATYVAQEQGFFEEEGFAAPEVIYTRSSTGAVQQLAAEGVDVGNATPDAIVQGVNQGSDIAMFVNTLEESPLSVIAQPGLEDWADLEGRLIGVSALQGGEIMLLKRLLREKGLSEADYDVQVAGNTPEKASALQGGSVDAAVLFSPTDFEVMDGGFPNIGNTAELSTGNQIPLTMYAIGNRWAEEENHGERVARAYLRANEWLMDPQNKEEAITIFSEVADQDPEHVESTYELWFEQLDIWTDGTITADQIQRVLDMMAEEETIQGTLPSPDEFFTNKYLEAAQE